ncbi:MAG TPA: protein-L-isoaspartate(D-aspartate) O-methyltransferase [Levilinea sp.]|nr:protein-L-isoaspartate(D-aspartate) O-methyltransferase [Levilinea sp.]
MTTESWFERERHRMVYEQIERRGIRHPGVLHAMRMVPRHLFVPLELQEAAYEDSALSIGSGQTISQPYIVALMTSLLDLHGDETILEVGTGSGYQAAVLSYLGAAVHTIERHEQLAQKAAIRLHSLGIHHVFVHQGDGSEGWPEAAPYQAIMVTAAAPCLPQALADQLDEGGRLILPVGPRRRQELQRWQRELGHLDYENIIPVAFVPLRGKYGWQEEDWKDERGS